MSETNIRIILDDLVAIDHFGAMLVATLAPVKPRIAKIIALDMFLRSLHQKTSEEAILNIQQLWWQERLIDLPNHPLGHPFLAWLAHDDWSEQGIWGKLGCYQMEHAHNDAPFLFDIHDNWKFSKLLRLYYRQQLLEGQLVSLAPRGWSDEIRQYRHQERFEAQVALEQKRELLRGLDALHQTDKCFCRILNCYDKPWWKRFASWLPLMILLRNQSTIIERDITSFFFTSS